MLSIIVHISDAEFQKSTWISARSRSTFIAWFH